MPRNIGLQEDALTLTGHSGNITPTTPTQIQARMHLLERPAAAEGERAIVADNEEGGNEAGFERSRDRRRSPAEVSMGAALPAVDGQDGLIDTSPGSLRVITERLRTIEESLAHQQRAGSAGPYASTSGQNGYGSYPSSATSQSYGFDGDVKRALYDGPALTSVSGGEVADPITTVTSAIKGLDQAMAAASPFAGGSQADTPDGSSPQQHVNGNGASANFEPDVPDAVSRGFVTVEEAQQLFDL